MRDLLVLLVGLLPASAAKNFALRRLGHRVAPGARIGPCLFVRVGTIELAEGAVIGPANTFRRLTRVRLGRNAFVGQLNWFSAAPFLVEHGDPSVAGELRLGAEAAITQRHYLDCSGGVLIDELALVAGVHSVFLTHEVDHTVNRLVSGPIEVGRHALVSSNTRLVMGARVPERSLVAMGTVVVRGLTDPGRLYAGVPARDKGPVDGAYFRRTEGEVPAGPADPRTTPR